MLIEGTITRHLAKELHISHVIFWQACFEPTSMLDNSWHPADMEQHYHPIRVIFVFWSPIFPLAFSSVLVSPNSWEKSLSLASKCSTVSVFVVHQNYELKECKGGYNSVCLSLWVTQMLFDQLLHYPDFVAAPTSLKKYLTAQDDVLSLVWKLWSRFKDLTELLEALTKLGSLFFTAVAHKLYVLSRVKQPIRFFTDNWTLEELFFC